MRVSVCSFSLSRARARASFNYGFRECTSERERSLERRGCVAEHRAGFRGWVGARARLLCATVQMGQRDNGILIEMMVRYRRRREIGFLLNKCTQDYITNYLGCTQFIALSIFR